MPRGKKSIGNKKNASNAGNGVMDVIKELWQAAVTLRGSIEPADYKRYVLPIIFLRFLSLRHERRREEIGLLLKDPSSEYYGDTRALDEPDEYRSVGAFILPEEARWENIVRHAQADDIKVRLDNILELLERSYPDKLRGLLPRIYAGSNLARESVTGLINLFSKDAFRRDYSGEDLIGRVYEYFIGNSRPQKGNGAASTSPHLPSSGRSWRCSNRTTGSCSTPAAAPAACSSSPTNSRNTAASFLSSVRRTKSSRIAFAG